MFLIAPHLTTKDYEDLLSPARDMLKETMAKKLIFWLLGLCFLSSPSFGVPYSNSQLQFKAMLPDNLEDVSIRVPVHGGLITLGKWNSSKSALVQMVSLQDLGGTIGREDLSKKKDKPANVTLEKTRWKTFDIDVFRVAENAGNISMLTFNAQVPLKPHAIQVMVSGPASEEASLKQQMQQIVASVDGPTNWLTGAESIARVAGGSGRLILIGCFLVVGVGGLLKIFRW